MIQPEVGCIQITELEKRPPTHEEAENDHRQSEDDRNEIEVREV